MGFFHSLGGLTGFLARHRFAPMKDRKMQRRECRSLHCGAANARPFDCAQGRDDGVLGSGRGKNKQLQPQRRKYGDLSATAAKAPPPVEMRGLGWGRGRTDNCKDTPPGVLEEICLV